ncbi:MAG: TMEM175 family protein [Gemmatimonadota bacterium]
MTRIETFTDAAFAFALTLLVISLDPASSYAELATALRAVPAFLLSATLLIVFWWGHHRWSRRYGLEDGPTVVLSWWMGRRGPSGEGRRRPDGDAER